LQCFQRAPTYAREIGIAKKWKSSVHPISLEFFRQLSRQGRLSYE
jgi:hypothetical protein